MVSTGLPRLSSTIRHPACAVADVPSAVGRLPTITQPVCNTASAVVSPTPPGQGPGTEFKFIWQNREGTRLGATPPFVFPCPSSFDLHLNLLPGKSLPANFP